MSDIPRFWRKRTLLSHLLRPLSWLFAQIAALRRARLQGKAQKSLPVPVIIVGNLSVGGNGKTPVVIALCKALSARGQQVGVISRGYGGTGRGVVAVSLQSSADIVGDEPLLIAQETQSPVVIGQDRLAAAVHLLSLHPELDWIISDDGLQHYRLPRTLELVVMACDLMIGNGLLLPAGPLREPLARLQEADALIYTGNPEQPLNTPIPSFTLIPQSNSWRWLEKPDWQGIRAAQSQSWTALTAIARPERFFNTLIAHGVALKDTIALPDHAALPATLANKIEGGIFISGKDAVKTRDWPQELRARTAVLGYEMPVPEALLDLIINKGKRT